MGDDQHLLLTFLINWQRSGNTDGVQYTEVV